MERYVAHDTHLTRLPLLHTQVGSYKCSCSRKADPFDSITMKAYDLGGHATWKSYFARALWKNCFTQVDGVVFLVDAANVERLGESKEQLDLLLTDDMLQKVPFAILGNKVDMPTALSEPALKQALGIEDQCTGKESKQQKGTFRPCEVFMCSVVKGFGYGDAFRWLSEYLEDA